jgi:hypothetical protein
MPNQITRGTGLFGTVRARAFNLLGTALAFTAAQFNQIMAAFGTVTFDRGVKVAKVALAGVDTGGGLFVWLNPEVGAILIDRVVLDVTTKSTGASTVAVGTTAVSAVTSSNNLLDAADLGTAAGTFDNITDKGSAGKSRQRLAAGGWVTGSRASGALAGIVGSVYVYYVNV